MPASRSSPSTWSSGDTTTGGGTSLSCAPACGPWRPTRAVPIAVPRLWLLKARLDVNHGRHRTGRRGFDHALREAQRLGMPWEQAEARRRMASLS